MKNKEKQFYLIDFHILPEAIKKTIRVKEMLQNGTKSTVNEAVKSMDMSRSAYYKYKDHVEPAFDEPKERTLVFFIMMQNDFALLNKIVKKINKDGNTILTMERGCPMEKYVPVTISFKTKDSVKAVMEMAESIRKMKGIQYVENKEGV